MCNMFYPGVAERNQAGMLISSLACFRHLVVRPRLPLTFPPSRQGVPPAPGQTEQGNWSRGQQKGRTTETRAVAIGRNTACLSPKINYARSDSRAVKSTGKYLNLDL